MKLLIKEAYKNRLPLPLKTIKEIHRIIDRHKDNLWIQSPLRNALVYISEYDYAEAIQILKYLQEDYPDLMDYKRHINYIKAAKQRYERI